MRRAHVSRNLQLSNGGSADDVSVDPGVLQRRRAEQFSFGPRDVRKPQSPRHCWPIAVVRMKEEHEALGLVDGEMHLTEARRWVEEQELRVTCPLSLDYMALLSVTDNAGRPNCALSAPGCPCLNRLTNHRPTAFSRSRRVTAATTSSSWNPGSLLRCAT